MPNIHFISARPSSVLEKEQNEKCKKAHLAEVRRRARQMRPNTQWRHYVCFESKPTEITSQVLLDGPTPPLQPTLLPAFGAHSLDVCPFMVDAQDMQTLRYSQCVNSLPYCQLLIFLVVLSALPNPRKVRPPEDGIRAFLERCKNRLYYHSELHWGLAHFIVSRSSMTVASKRRILSHRLLAVSILRSTI
jgi:hypothetical protein